jgi:hypothetical protein
MIIKLNVHGIALIKKNHVRVIVYSVFYLIIFLFNKILKDGIEKYFKFFFK